MNVYEIKLKVYLLKDITSIKSAESIAQLIDKSLSKTEHMRRFHEDRKFKFYTFNSFYPLELDKVYKAGNIYTVLIRTVDEKLKEYFKRYVENEYTDKIKVLTLESKEILYRHINKLYSITPCILKFDGYWKDVCSLQEYEERLKINLIKKFREFYDVKLDEHLELFNHIEFRNKKPISIPMKNVCLLGDKLELQVADNDNAQALSYFALGVGLAELN